MKLLIKLLLICILLQNQKVFAQITLEQTFSNGIYGITNLGSHGYKYIDYSGISPDWEGYPGTAGPGVHVRNLDGTLYRTLSLPTLPSPETRISGLFYVSETLFNTNPDDLEYFMLVYSPNQYGYFVLGAMVVEETGEILLSESSCSTYEWFTTEFYFYSVYKTDQGTKLQLEYFNVDSLGNVEYLNNKIFSLPGNYSTEIQTPPPSKENFSNYIFPNPSSGEANIQIDLPANISKAVILFYEQSGNMVKQIKINPQEKLIKIDNSMLSPGVYFYQILTTPSTRIQSKKMIIVK
jgi:hypothetical protein